MWKCKKCGEKHEEAFDICWKCGNPNEEADINHFDKDDIDLLAELIYSTTGDIATHQIVNYVSVVSGEAILGANIISDFITGVTDIVGGRSGTYESYLQEGRKIALHEMGKRAVRLKANAIIGIRFDYETIRGTMLMVTCSGTAVIIEKKI